MSTGTIVITLPIPPKVLSPNSSQGLTRKGAMYRAATKKKYRAQAAIWAAKATGSVRHNWASATVQVRWFGRTHQCLRMDDQNAIATLKAGVDGALEDAGIVVNDKVLTWAKPVFAVDKANPRVELVVSRVSEEQHND